MRWKRVFNAFRVVFIIPTDLLTLSAISYFASFVRRIRRQHIETTVKVRGSIFGKC